MSKSKVFDTETFFEEKPFDYVEYMVDSWKSWIAEIITELEKIKSNEIKLLTYFSIIDMMAQEYFNYPDRKNQKTFTDFVLVFQNKYDFLELVDPITLYYHVEDIVKNNVNLEELEDGSFYYPKTNIIRDKVADIRAILEPIKGVEFCDSIESKHRYVDLLYRIRCRLSHEFSSRHTFPNERETQPYYINCYRQYVTKGKIISDEVWQLIYPVKFVQDLCLNCFENYLQYCLDNHVPPGKNNGMDRFCELSWYN